MSKVDVFVIGAGPFGLCTALDLVRRGHSVRIVDKASVHSNLSRAIVVWARSLRDFEQLLGAEDFGAFAARGVRADRAVLRDADVQIGELQLDGVGLLVSQAVVEATLIAKLQALGVQIEWNTVVSELLRHDDVTRIDSPSIAEATADDSAVHIRIAPCANDGEHSVVVSAKFVVAADGVHSFVRKAVGLAFDGHRVDAFRAVAADVEVEPNHGVENAINVFLPRAATDDQRNTGVLFRLSAQPTLFRYVSILPMPENTDDAALHAAPPPPATLIDMIERSTSSAALAKPVKVSQLLWSSAFVIHERQISRQAVGRILFGGDAAHCHSPIGGQGMNLGLQDAAAMAWRISLLLRHPNAPVRPLVQTYAVERAAIARMIIDATNRINPVVGGVSTGISHWAPQPVRRSLDWLRNHVISLALSSDWVAATARGVASQMHHTYAGLQSLAVGTDSRYGGVHVPLITNAPRLLPPLPGELAPVLSAEKRHDFVVVSLAPVCTVPETTSLFCSAVVIDTDERASQFGLAPDTCKLIRPDGHVALCAQRDNAVDLITQYFIALGLLDK